MASGGASHRGERGALSDYPSTRSFLQGPSHVQLSVRHFADVVVALPAGRIDHAAAGLLEAQLMPVLERSAADHLAAVLDFANVEYISSVGLRVLMIAAKSMRARDRLIAIAALQPLVAEIFAISRFDKVLTVYPSVRAALEALSPTALAAFDRTPAPGAA
ncbi:MAG: STAS domain-containing protein [Casimicrobiaceae bacterium]